MKWQRVTGIVFCLLLIASCFMHWAWYPDIQEYFTGFYSKHNYYGRPGILLTIIAAFGAIFYYADKAWADRLNLIFSGIALAYAITSFLRFISGYDGFVPEKQAGIFIMIFSALGHLLISAINLSYQRIPVSQAD
jgi:uncharacterized membrane protein YfhO